MRWPSATTARSHCAAPRKRDGSTITPRGGLRAPSRGSGDIRGETRGLQRGTVHRMAACLYCRTEATDPAKGPDPSNREPKWDVMETIETAEVIAKIQLAIDKYGVST